MDDEEQAADAVTEEPSLRDTLEAAFEAPTDDAPEQEAVVEPAADEQTAEQRARDEKGRFAKQEGDAPEQPAADAQPQDGEPAPAPEPQATDAHLTGETPPPGWNVSAKNEWSTLSPAIKEAIAKREQEVNSGFQQYAGLGPYQQEAARNGRTLAESLEAYTAAENFLEKSPVDGIKWFMQTYGVSPEQLGAPAQEGEGNPADPIVQHLTQTVTQLEQKLNGFERNTQQQQMHSAQSMIDQFTADPANIYFENVRPQMAVLMQSGAAQDIKSAYEQACWMNPEIREKLVMDQITASQADKAEQVQQAATQARKAAKSVSGDPNGAVPNGQAPKETLRGELEAAFSANRA